VRKDDKSSSVKCLSNGERILGMNRSTLNSEIDSRIFFGTSIILCEGYADELFLENMVRELRFDLDGNGVLIMSTRGMGVFRTYCLLMNFFGIKYVIMADTDGTSDALLLSRKAGKFTGVIDEKFALVGEEAQNKPRVFFIKGNLEEMLSGVDSDAYNRSVAEVARSEGKKDSKPLIVQEFLERQVAHDKRRDLTLLIKPIFENAMLRKDSITDNRTP
jgi:predicted ATP-dependent endonuclease of OLD family